MIKKLLLAATLASVALLARADTFSLFAPSNGLMVGDQNTYITTSATSSDVTVLWSGTCNNTTFLRADGSCQAVAGGVTGLANPTGTIGLTAVNGSATTALRSDGAPALSQAIAPTWTGIHNFSNGTTEFSYPLYSVNARRTVYGVTAADAWGFYSLNDAGNAFRLAWEGQRSGLAWTTITFGNATDNPTYTFAGSGAISGNGGGLTNIQDSALSSNVALKNAANTFTNAAQTISATNAQWNTTDGAVQAGIVSSLSSGIAAVRTISSHPLELWTANTSRGAISAAGNWTINAPSSGLPLSVAGGQTFTTGSVERGYIMPDATGLGLGYSSNYSAGGAFYAHSGGAQIYAGAAAALSINTSGNATINAPSSGITLALAAGSSGALNITAGAASGLARITLTEGAQAPALIYQLPSSDSLGVYVAGGLRATLNTGLILGAPTGGDLGAGTLNTAGDIRINNVSVCRSDGTNCPSSSIIHAYAFVDASACSVSRNANVSGCSSGGTGFSSVTLTGFSATPVCTVTPFPGVIISQLDVTGPTTVNVDTLNLSGTPADSDYNLICVGT